MKRRLTSFVLALCLIVSIVSVGIIPASADTTTVETYAQDTIEGSAVLHCFDWSYNNIKAALPDIAKAGYTAVQTSPVQAPKDYSASWTDGKNQWWKLYQPLGFSISTGSTWLGTKSELTSLCTEAEKYGIKVIVDVVANHVANNGTDGGTYSYVNSGVESQLQGSAYYHTNNTRTSDTSRYTITQYHLGMPDLNTANTTVQQRVISLLKECIDCGVDGFRFDAAKHIELPTDDSGCKSDFWPNVLNAATSYAAAKGVDAPFYYGEILGSAGTDISNYTTYMAVTDNYTGDRALDKAYWSAASELADSTYYKGASASKSVLWVESHDTYMGSSGSSGFTNTASVDDEDIIRAWAIVGARADSTSLFFARPNSTMGAASTDTTWKSTAVAEINKFKNHFDGTSEYLASSGNTAYIERGTKGVVISKLDGSGSVNLTAHQMASGTYTDQISGNTFSVSNGKISGTVGSTGVAVVYNANDDALSYITESTLYLKPSSNWTTDGARFAMYVFNSATGSTQWVSMTSTGSDGYYSASVPSGNWTNVIFCRMDPAASTNNWDNKWNQTSDLFPNTGTNCYTVADGTWDEGGGTWSVYSSSQTEATSATSATTATEATSATEASSDTYTVYAYNKLVNWSNMYVYWWGSASNNPEWPGEKMEQGSAVYVYDIPSDAKGIIFNNGSGSQTVDITSGITDNAQWVIKTTQENGKYLAESGPTYYLVGTPNNWTQNNSYAFSLNRSSTDRVQYKLSNVSLTAGDELKVNDTKNNWYPGGSNNNYSVTETGTYDVYFRPNADGNSDWHESYFYLDKVVQTYTVTWKNYDGTTLETDENVPEGTTPTYDGEAPTKEPTADTVYTFSGWSPTVSAVTGDVTYIAQFTESVRTYIVTWKNYNGTVLETDENVAYGSTPSYDGETPTRTSNNPGNTYVFSGWSPSPTTVTGDVTYTAKFSKNTKSYTITWVDGDGNTIKTETVLENVMPAYTGTTPTKTADAQYTYTFNGTWTPGVVAAEADATYTANFDSTVNTYTVTWKDSDGNTLDTDTVAYGETPAYTGETPTKAADAAYTYTFSGWSPEVSAVTGDITYTAQFTSAAIGSYTIYVTNNRGWDDVYCYYWTDFGDNSWPGVKMTATDNEIVYTAAIPANAKGIVFSNGDTSDMKQTVNIESGIEDGAHWYIRGTQDSGKYLIRTVPTYYLVGTMTEWKTDNAPVFAPHKSSDGAEEYKLTTTLNNTDQIKVYGGETWYPSGDNYTVTADGTYSIYFRPNADGGDDWHEKVIYVKNITSYTVTWVDGDGNTLKTDTATYGDTPAYTGATPTKTATFDYTYTFNNTWSPAITPVTGDATYTAQFSETAREYFTGYSLTLKGEIGVNFFIDLRGESPENATVTLSWYQYTETVSLSDLTPEANGTYKVTCYVAAKEMNDDITAVLTIGGAEAATDTYSVAQYANRIIENEDGEFDDLFPTDNTKLSKLQELAKAMLHYGAEAQKYFDHNTDALADSSLSGYTPAEIDSSKLTTHDYADDAFSDYGLIYSGNSLLLKDTTTLRVFFTPDDNYDGTKVYYGDTELTAGTRGKYVYFDIVGIKAADILNDRTLTFKKSDNSQNVTFNISDYIADMKDKDSTREILKALYDYNRRAVAFFG